MGGTKTDTNVQKKLCFLSLAGRIRTKTAYWKRVIKKVNKDKKYPQRDSADIFICEKDFFKREFICSGGDRPYFLPSCRTALPLRIFDIRFW